MGSRPDGWWNDRTAGMARLTQEVAEWCWTHDDSVVLVFDGRSKSDVTELGGGNLRVAFSERSGRNAADDHIIAELGLLADLDQQTVTVVTADKGLIARLPTGVSPEGPRRFLERMQE